MPVLYCKMSENTKKKICYISYRKVRCSVVDNFSKAVADSGYDVSVITLRNQGEPEVETENGRKVYRVDFSDEYPLTRRRNRWHFIFKTIPILIHNRFAIIQITSTCPYFSILKLFTFFHAKSIYHILSYPVATSYARSLKRMLIAAAQCLFMDKIVVQSAELKRNWVGLSKLEKAIVIPVGFNKHEFYPLDHEQKLKTRSDLGLRPGQPVLVYSGAIAHHRKIDNLVTALKIVRELHNDVKLLMIGAGDALTDIQDLASQLDLQDSLMFTGRVPYTEVNRLISAADVGLSYIPVNNNYNFNPPLKTFEYLACGLPTIATRTESNASIIQDGISGILVNDSPADLAASINRLLADKELQNHLSRNARSSVLKYDFNYIARNCFIPLYQELLDET